MEAAVNVALSLPLLHWPTPSPLYLILSQSGCCGSGLVGRAELTLIRYL